LLATPRDPYPPARSPRDWLLVLLVTIVAVTEPFLEEGSAEWVAVGLSVIIVCLIPWRRSHPLQINIAYAVGFILIDILNAGDELFSMDLAWILITYALTRWASGRKVAFGLVVLTATYSFHIWIYAFHNVNDVYAKIVATGFSLIPAFIGGVVRYRAELRRHLIDEARHNERAQLARELHDTVAHSVSAIAIQAQAARVVADSKPNAVIGPLKAIEGIASRTLTEMRKIVGALRVSTEAETAPQPRLADIERLVRDNPGGPRIDVNLSGKLDSLPPSVETGLYRIAREAITNARRHARHASSINVQIYGAEDSVSLTITDDGKAASHSEIVSPGFGLTGMKERARLLGGKLEAGPDPDGGWYVRAVIPTGGA